VAKVQEFIETFSEVATIPPITKERKPEEVAVEIPRPQAVDFSDLESVE
jgi:hypothetical protein